MDGLQIRNGQSLLDTGKTTNEVRNDGFNIGKPLGPGQTDPANKSFADTLKDAVGQVSGEIAGAGQPGEPAGFHAKVQDN